MKAFTASPACKDAGVDPEIWFPEPYDFRKDGEEKDEAMKKAILALKICNSCPLFKNGECIKYAMQDMSTIEYGIWAGTLPAERVRAVTRAKPVNGVVWQYEIRKEATRRGLIRPLVEKRERPGSSIWDYLDARVLIGKGMRLSD